MTEWSLAAFTLLLQLACGSAIASALADWMLPQPDAGLMRPIGISIFPLAAAALAASAFHLGRPLSAWRAFSNLGGSRLSLEVLLCALFVLAACAGSWMWWAGRCEGRLLIGAAAGALGTAAVISSTLVYRIPAQPAWQSGWIPVSFLGSMLLFCGMAPVLLTGWRGEGTLRRIYLGAVCAGGLALLAAAAWMMFRLSQPPADEFAVLRMRDGFDLILRRNGVWLGAHLVLAGVLPMLVASRLWLGRGAGMPGQRASRLIFLAALAGVAIGRALMFALAALPKTWGNSGT
jgi:DMSO reductase anchor subunit